MPTFTKSNAQKIGKLGGRPRVGDAKVMVRCQEERLASLDDLLEIRRKEFQDRRRKVPAAYRSRAAYMRAALEFAMTHEWNTGEPIDQ